MIACGRTANINGKPVRNPMVAISRGIALYERKHTFVSSYLCTAAFLIRTLGHRLDCIDRGEKIESDSVRAARVAIVLTRGHYPW